LSQWTPEPPQGFSSEQEQIIIGRPPIPRFGAPQGIAAAIIAEIMNYENNLNMGYEVDDWFNGAWAMRIPLTINTGQITGTITDFPLLINSTFADLIGETEAELRFTGADNIQLDYEIQSFDTLTGELIAWINVPSIQDGDSIRIYYDNPAAVDEQNPFDVWSDYSNVYHLNNVVASNSILDSTIAQEPGDPIATTLVDGKIGKAQDFDQSASPDPSHILFPSLNVNFTLSISVWFKTTDSDRGSLFSIGDGGPGSGVFSEIVANGAVRYLYRVPPGVAGGVNFNSITTGFNDGNFHKMVYIYDNAGTISRLFIDGVNDANFGNALPFQDAATDDGVLGRVSPTDSALSYTGIMDEFEVFVGALSDDRIAAEFNNQDAPDTFYATSASETIPSVQMGYETT